MRATKLLVMCACLALVGCDSEETTPADSGTPGTDSGPSGTDSGPGTDAGPGDMCAAGTDDAISSLGCNGGVYGSTPMDNQIGGPCTPDGMDPPGPGTCTAGSGAAMPLCVPDDADPSVGTCVWVCPSAGTYVSTGDCPTGSRCFNLMDFSICFRDCNSAADCFAGEECDGEGSCVGGAPPMTDGGMPGTDAGVPVDATVPMVDGGAG